MNDKKLTILGLIALFMVCWAVIQARISNRQTVVQKSTSYLIQGLNPDTVEAIKIKTGNNQMKLQRSGAAFVLADKDNYPALFSKVNELFAQILDIQTDELITSNPANHPDLEVDEDTAGCIVKFLDKNGEFMTGLVIGRKDESQGTYVRLYNSNDVYISSNAPTVRTSPMDYIEQTILRIEQEDINSVTVTDTNGVSYTLRAGREIEDVIFDGDVPSGKKLGNRHHVVFNAFAYLRFDDVMKDDSAKELVFDMTYIGRLKDNTVYILKLAKNDKDDLFARLSADYPDKEDVLIDVSKKVSDEELKQKEAKLLAREAVDKFNRKCKGWVYKIPSWKAKNLTSPLNELFVDANQPDTEQSEE